MRDRGEGPIVGAKPSFVDRVFGNFSIKRGLKGFGLGLLISPAVLLLKYDSSEEFHWDGVPIFMLIVAIVCGLWGLFTKKDIPL